MLVIRHPIFVLVAIAIAFVGSWISLDLFGRVRANVGRARAAWLISASLALGLSVWAMHFVAMLGFDPGSPVRYDPSLTILSLILAVGVTGCAFALAGASRTGRAQFLGAGLLLIAGVGATHYVAMAAIESPSGLLYDQGRVILSLVFPVAPAIGAMLAVQREGSPLRRLFAAAALGLAILAVHYTGMSATLTGGAAAVAPPTGSLGSSALAVTVSAATIFVLFLASIAALFDQRFQALAAVEAKRSFEQLLAILEQTPVGILVAEAPSGQIRFANSEATHLLGAVPGPEPTWEQNDGFGLMDKTGGRPRPEDHSLYRAVRWGQRTDGEIQVFKRPDGSIRTLEVTAAPVRDQDGRITQGIQTFHDVSDKLKAEEALRQSQRMESIGQLTGGVAHDFNNLLTAVLGSLSLASRQVADERTQFLIGNAVQAAQRGARLISQLLAFSRRQQLTPCPVDVNEAISRMSGLLASTLGGTVRIHTVLAKDLPPALADPAQLELALLNLALNARDAMPDGGSITLTTAVSSLGPARTPVEPDRGRYVAIGVADNGPGMTPEVAERAFEPFFTTKGEGRGSGMGLSQVLGLAKQLGGGVRIDSPPGAGCTVWLYLPISTEPAKLAAHDDAKAISEAVAGASILVVDDDDAVRRVVTELLTDAGCTVHDVGDGLSGLQALETHGPFDLMMLDFAMPSMTGAEVARQVRERYPHQPILMMTGYLEHEAVLAQLGAQPILQKPFVSSELLERIAALMKRGPEA